MLIMSNSIERIFVAGHRGMVGSALVRALRDRSDCQLVLRSHDELDLLDAEQVAEFFANEQINTVYLAAAKAGGIHANNTQPAEFIHENLLIEANVIHQAWKRISLDDPTPRFVKHRLLQLHKAVGSILRNSSHQQPADRVVLSLCELMRS